METKWKQAIAEGKNVSVEIKVNYTDNALRPSSFDIKSKIDGEIKTVTLLNQNF
ncbi:DNA/RNA non-specific endonuclease [Enterococcus sp. LJL128]